MKPIDNFANETWNLQLLENILLRLFFSNDLVKTIVLLCIVILLEDRDGTAICIYAQQVSFVSFLGFMRQEWSHSYSNSNV